MGAGIATHQRGAGSEAEVARALRRLPEGWFVFHDVPWRGRPGVTIDHVVVGPAGVFVIEAESWDGTIEVRDGVLTQDGQSREQAVDLAARAAIAVQGVVPGRCFPVVCFDGAPLSAWARDVLVCSSSTVLLKLRSLPHRLSDDDVRRCVAAIEAQSRHRHLSVTSMRARTKRQPERRKQARPVLFTVALLELVLGALLVLSGSVQDTADWVTQGYVSVTDKDDRDMKPVRIRRDVDPRHQGAHR
ncbi:hypothetical protein F4692_000735 [Nocardioides cavernae]|uniref:NERD domain-containing protein n=1 Tax=Nocardioides cavernae TaxID=1921566 RepID=A0A7Y9H0C0_9ACTN|nr:nuclease-related domain-containing protein [Nocardioides cavernae]NYE35631.1 hypothetical protein [Nocardioides cavernae]